MLSLFWLGFALAATPGPDFFLLTSNTLTQGRKMGYITLLGNRLSLLTHLTAALYGLAFLLQRFSVLYHMLHIAGALYLLYLGARKLQKFGKGAVQDVQKGKHFTMKQAFLRGYLNNLLNPKVSLFFLSLFPQFATPDQLSKSPVLVGLVLFLGNCLWNVPIVYVIGIARVREVVRKYQTWLDHAFGFVFWGLGLRMIWGELSNR